MHLYSSLKKQKDGNSIIAVGHNKFTNLDFESLKKREFDIL